MLKYLLNPKRIWKYLRVKFFILGYFLSALIEYWFSPWGRRGGLRARLQELPARGQDGRLPSPARVALFVGFSEQLTLSNQAYLETLIRAGFAIVYISNCRLQATAREAIGRLAWRLFERRNIGRDVGAFRDGVLWLEQQGHLDSCSTLLIANDSMQFLPGRYADRLIAELQAFEQSDDVGLFSHVSQSHGTHYQSYFQVLKRPIFSSPEFLGFWHAYVPLSHRGHCIFKGEIALSTNVYRRFRKVRVLYTSEGLQAALEARQAEQGSVPAAEILRLMPSLARTVQRRRVGFSLQQILSKSDSDQSLADWQLYCIADVIESNNPSHVAAFLFPLYLHCPLVKQDLCSAGTYSIAQVLSLFREALEDSCRDLDGLVDIEAHVREFGEVLYVKATPMSYTDKPRESALKGITGGFVYSSTYDGNL